MPNHHILHGCIYRFLHYGCGCDGSHDSPCSTRWWAADVSWQHLWYGSSETKFFLEQNKKNKSTRSLLQLGDDLVHHSRPIWTIQASLLQSAYIIVFEIVSSLQLWFNNCRLWQFDYCMLVIQSDFIWFKKAICTVGRLVQTGSR